MKQKQDIFSRNSQNDEKELIPTKKNWEPLKIHILPVPGLTQGGTIRKNAKEGNTKIYRPLS